MNEPSRNPHVETPDLFHEIRAFAQFSDEDSANLAALHPIAEPHLRGIVETFYDRVEATDATRQVVEAHSSRQRLSGTLLQWMHDFLRGPHDRAYFEKRQKIGRMHVKVGLEPHYVFTALTVLRNGLVPHATPQQAASVHRMMDIELAIINDCYWGDVTAALQRTERLATIGELSASLAHEIRNPLAAMQNASFLLQNRVDPGDARVQKHLSVLERAVGECTRLVTSMLEFARSQTPVFRRVSTSGLVAMAVTHARPPSGVTVETDLRPGSETLVGDEVQIRGIIRNLITNAVQAMDGDGLVALSAERQGDEIVIRVRDTGPGIPEDRLDEIFKPLTTSKVYGLGLGLAYSRRVAESHGGSLNVEPTPSGACFALRLPAAPSESSDG